MTTLRQSNTRIVLLPPAHHLLVQEYRVYILSSVKLQLEAMATSSIKQRIPNVLQLHHCCI
jgi:hypothetical protein